MWIFCSSDPRTLLVDEVVEVEVSLVTKDDFVVEYTINWQLFQDPVGKVPALSVVSRLQFLSQLDLERMKMQIFCQNSLKNVIFFHSFPVQFPSLLF